MKAVGDRIDELAATGDGSRLVTAFASFDDIRGYFEPATVEKVGVLLAAASGTYKGTPIDSERLKKRVDGAPYDAARVELFAKAAAELNATAPIARPVIGPETDRKWLPFFEAYFSNYIEGTRFSVEEAYAIAVDGDMPEARPKDAHDISGTYRIVNDLELMRQAPRDVDDFIEHAQGPPPGPDGGRPEKRPGEFKVEPNYAGMTAFVARTMSKAPCGPGGSTSPAHRPVPPSRNDDVPRHRVPPLRRRQRPHRASHDQRRAHRPRRAADRDPDLLPQQLPGDPERRDERQRSRSTHLGVGLLRRWVAAVDWSDWDRCRADLDASNAFEDPAIAEHSGRRLRLPGGLA